MQTIKLVLLTGFLGAGKTTLLKSILDEYNDRKIGIIINEFGKVNIDARLVEKNGVEMAEVSNGSIFCACLKENFVKSLIEMSKMELEYIFIEASGLADPSNMTSLVESIQNKLLYPFDYKGAICVVDGEHFLGLLDVLPALSNQIEYSGWALINKADLISESQIEEIRNTILKINSETIVIPTVYCKTDLRRIMDEISDVNKDSKESSNTVESRPRTFILKGKASISKEKLQDFLKAFAQDTYRIKGFINTPEGNVEISCVGTTIYILPWEKELPTHEIAVISAVGPKIIRPIADAMERYLDGEISF